MRINLRQDTKALKGATIVQVQNADGSFFTITSLEYADDVELNATSIKDLQAMVTIFGEMCAAFGMQISTKKTVVMAVEHGLQSKGRKVGDDEEGDEDEEAGEEVTDAQAYDPIILNKVVLKRVSTFCYLGHMLNSKGTLTNEIAARASRMRSTFLSLKSSVFCNRHLPIRVKLAAFNAAVVENGLYACEVWSVTAKQMDLLDGVQHQLLKKICGFGIQSRVSKIRLIEQAARHGVVVLPVSVRIRLTKLRYGGHIARRQEYLLKSEKACRQMDLLLPGVNLNVPHGLVTGTAKPGKVTGATAHRSALQAAGLPVNEWSALAKQSSKADWRRLLKGKVTQNLMLPWIERQLKGKTARESAAEKVGRAILPADIHDKKCHLCRKFGKKGERGHLRVLRRML